MNKENYIQLKQELKTLAKEIKKTKPLLKETQRSQSKYERLVMNRSKDYYWKSHKLDGWYEVVRPAKKYQEKLKNLQCEFRAKHIIYCLERGRMIKEIEPKIKDKYDYHYNYVYCTLIPRYIKECGFDKLDSLPDKTLRAMGWIEHNGQIRMFTREEMRG